MFTLLQIRDLRIFFTKNSKQKNADSVSVHVYVLCVVFPVGIAVGVVHRAERLAGGARGAGILGLRLAMCYISKPKPRNNLYTKNMLI